MKNTKRIWIAIAVVTVAAALIAARMLTNRETTQYFTEKIDRGDIRDVVEATGTINAVITVQVGSQVSGTIDRLNADFNSHVKKDQIIARIDPSLFEGSLLQAKADLETARANVTAARANVEKAKAAEAQSRADYERTKPLAAEGVVSSQQLDVSKANEDSAVASIDAAKASLLQAQAQASQKAAAVTVAQLNLDHTTIRAPIDGVVVSRNVDIGQTVAASLQAPTLFTIAQDLTKMQVYTKTDESDVGQIRAALPVTFKVDAFPNDQFNGNVSQIRMNATTVQNVVTYDTIIDFANPEMKLFPGMTAYVTIPVAIAHDVLKVPNAALRYKPDLKPEEVKDLYAKAGITMSARTPSAAGGSGPRPPGSAGGDQKKETRTTNDVAVVWKMLPDQKMEPVQIRTGITDHTTTQLLQVLKGELKEGDVLLTGSSKGAASRPGSSPLGGPPRGR
ncbi:MAG: efflux RND transporter periplasmic adaptor subunit [Acidobacteriia bacterium]|nr:efflux RND transporter periplasmic adaptor subunit [Terriglobia bacterium]